MRIIVVTTFNLWQAERCSEWVRKV